MKLHYLLILFLLSLISGCSTGASDIESDFTFIPDAAVKIAEYHNEAADYVFRKLKEEDREFTSLEDLLETSRNAEVEYYQKRFGSKIIQEHAIEGADFGRGILGIASYKEKNYNPVELSGSVAFINSVFGDVLTNNQIRMLQAADSLMTSGNSFEHTVAQLTELQYDVLKLPENEREVMFITLEVAKKSSEYWSQNLDEWQEIFGHKTKVKPEISWGLVGKADLAGALAGGVRCLVLNAIPGAGQVTYIGSVTGTAVSLSVTTAILQIL